jgi:restriction system protein
VLGRSLPNQSPNLWQQFCAELDGYERVIHSLHYPDLLEQPSGAGPSEETLWLEGTERLLHIERPHGYALITPPAIPKFPPPPQRPPLEQPPSFLRKLFSRPDPAAMTDQQKKEQLQRSKKLRDESEALRNKFEAQAGRWKTLRANCEANDKAAIKFLMSISNIRHPLPRRLQAAFDVEIDLEARIALATIEIPDFNSLAIVKPRQRASRSSFYTLPDWQPVNASEKKRAIESVLYSLPIRAACLIALSDEENWFDTIVVNATQKWIDKATGQPRSGVVASLQATSEELIRLRLDQVEPKACFRHLKGLATPSTEDVVPIRPIFTMSRDDDRIVRDRDVAEGLQPDTNLAAMPWDDFEHLVRQLFEWEFANNGAEVKITRASRDRGVDAIVFDPDPLRGGKFVIQAKRYTAPVDVASVRDLYGTVMNEGANRGILVTTSGFGRDSYEFAKDKPISLVDGPNLIAMLRKHGRSYRIDLAEARRMAAEAGGDL